MTTGDVTGSIGTVLQVWDRIKGYFEDFKPELKSQTINCRSCSCEFIFKIKVDSGIRRRFSKIELPIEKGYRIKNFFTSLGGKVESEGFYRDNGKVDPSFIRTILDVTPSKNRNQTSEYDSYWLDARIGDMSLFAEIQKLSDVDIKVNVAIDHIINVLRPPHMAEDLKSTRKFIRKGKDANRDHYSASPIGKILLDHTIRLVSTDQFTLKVKELIDSISSQQKYLKTKQEKGEPYDIGEIITYPQYGFNPITDVIIVNTHTNLTKSEPHARSLLLFCKKDFIEDSKKSLEEILNNFNKKDINNIFKYS